MKKPTFAEKLAYVLKHDTTVSNEFLRRFVDVSYECVQETKKTGRSGLEIAEARFSQVERRRRAASSRRLSRDLKRASSPPR